MKTNLKPMQPVCRQTVILAPTNIDRRWDMQTSAMDEEQVRPR
ncbi:hypothetical protein I547_5781 [Mycobacterium kansasii 824]|uniref:Uncharacterized protein n=1 Tax=Mycobacterium kansasii TaxID=1768 RepID=A0A1V3X564_MYCKA|nr:hypothetical protein I547_5781 [Mycobacterium kansasii 824]OOK73621.1 hypothetical protein BZL30_4689 [Mycobacterium kansasii]